VILSSDVSGSGIYGRLFSELAAALAFEGELDVAGAGMLAAICADARSPAWKSTNTSSMNQIGGILRRGETQLPSWSASLEGTQGEGDNAFAKKTDHYQEVQMDFEKNSRRSAKNSAPMSTNSCMIKAHLRTRRLRRATWLSCGV
jgi:hypothetical protein